jgi:histidine triad (HIT) family protein
LGKEQLGAVAFRCFENTFFQTIIPTLAYSIRLSHHSITPLLHHSNFTEIDKIQNLACYQYNLCLCNSSEKIKYGLFRELLLTIWPNFIKSLHDVILIGRRHTMEDCIFCKIIKGDIPCFKVYEDDRVLAFADINPITAGHTLIIPKVHAENLWEISEADITAIHLASKKIAVAIKDALKPVGIAVLQLNGRGVNQVVMHYHLHLIPRTGDAAELKMTAWDLIPGDMAAIKGMSERIAAAIG